MILEFTLYFPFYNTGNTKSFMCYDKIVAGKVIKPRVPSATAVNYRASNVPVSVNQPISLWGQGAVEGQSYKDAQGQDLDSSSRQSRESRERNHDGRKSRKGNSLL